MLQLFLPFFILDMIDNEYAWMVWEKLLQLYMHAHMYMHKT